MTRGISIIMAKPIFSEKRDSPGPLEAVKAVAPAVAAPIQCPMEEISSSPWIPIPPTLGSSRNICVNIPDAGVMGYPAKKSHPASKAPLAIAAAPSIISFCLVAIIGLAVKLRIGFKQSICNYCLCFE